MKRIVFFPFGGNAREAIDAIEAINARVLTWEFLGFIDDNKNTWGSSMQRYPVLGGREILKENGIWCLAVPGRAENFYNRKDLINGLNHPKKQFATIIHPSANISEHCKIGYNTLIMEGVVVKAGVNIGNSCVILPNSVISHDSEICDYTLIGSNVSISGGVMVNECCYIGTGAKIISDVIIGTKSLIGLGAIVLNNVEDNSVMVGNPARSLRKIR